MTDRMTDERLAEIQAEHDALEPQHITDDWFYWEEMPGNTTKEVHQHRGELIQALKAERDDNTVLRRVNKNHLERIRELEADLRSAGTAYENMMGVYLKEQERIRELEATIDRIRKLSDRWRTVSADHTNDVCADELEEALADD